MGSEMPAQEGWYAGIVRAIFIFDTEMAFVNNIVLHADMGQAVIVQASSEAQHPSLSMEADGALLSMPWCMASWFILWSCMAGGAALPGL